ncbi:MAG: DeoR/GlpR transcriptional regulator [Lachnospiraceae bacterium]|nr:DeoR/GlpR transcriptional regulator [Lachnospiraceae bacterium]
MIQGQRFQKIEEMVNERGIVNTREMAEILGVTETTIRRDYEELEKLGKIVRVHGGARSLKKRHIVTMGDELEIEKRTAHAREKDAVCKKAASFVEDGACVFLDGGSSIVPMVKYLKNRRVKIVTNSLLAANAFHSGEAEVFVIGGSYIPKYGMSIGPLSIEALSKFNFDYAFISCIGVDLDRKLIYTAEIETMAIKDAVMKLSSTNILLLDSSKLYLKAFCSLVPLTSFDIAICNNDISINPEDLPGNFILVDVDESET